MDEALCTTMTAVRNDHRLVCLTGFMGAGKTSVGKAVAATLKWQFVDLDSTIEAAEGATIAEIFARGGEHIFREREAAVLRQILQERAPELLLSLGGGTLTRAENQEELRRNHAFIIFLNAPLDELWQRVGSEGGAVRPLLKDRASFDELYFARLSGYREADTTVDVGGKSLDEIANEVLTILAEAR
jgi:shikimate kinase